MQEECQEGRGSPPLLLATLRPKTLSRCKRFFSPVDLLVLRMGQMMGGQGGVPGGPAGPGGPPPDMASLLQVVPWLLVPSLYLTYVNQAGQQLAQQMQQSNPELVEQLRRQMGGGPHSILVSSCTQPYCRWWWSIPPSPRQSPAVTSQHVLERFCADFTLLPSGFLILLGNCVVMPLLSTTPMKYIPARTRC